MAARTSKGNRTAGLKWEREVARLLREHGYPNAVTSRAANRARDAEKIDIVNKEEFTQGRMMDDIQVKNTQSIDWGLLHELEKLDKGKVKRRKVLIVKLGKTTQNGRSHKGNFALMFLRDYLSLLELYRATKQYARTLSQDDWLKVLSILDKTHREHHD